MPRLNEFPHYEAAFDIQSSVLSPQKVIHLQTIPNISPKFTRCGLGEHALPTQQCTVVDNLPRFGGDSTVGRMLPWGGTNYILLELLLRGIELCLGAPGKGEGDLLRPLLVPLQLPPPLCVNYDNKRAMVGVVQRHPNACALKSSAVGFPP
jgi:hypothetical protein